MKKRIYSILCGWLLLLAQVCSAGFPVLSSGDEVTWYIVQFLNGGAALTASGDGSLVKTATLTGDDSQLWKVEGSAGEGYTLTSKTGLRLYTDTTAKNGNFYAASNPSQNTAFAIVATGLADYSGGYEIQPAANGAVSMNQWGGAGIGKNLGLWDKDDPNNPLRFVGTDELAENAEVPLIPYPASLVKGDGRLAVNSLTAITYVDEETKTLAEGFAARLSAVSGISLGVEAAGASRRAQAVSLAADASLGEEAYRLAVDAEGVSIAASGRAGFFYALQTLRQLLPAAIFGEEPAPDADWTLPFVEIDDAPHLGHRGFMLDVARHFFSKEEVKKLIDVAAVYKFNRFHWHLTDDQGWRIEIPEYPRLTTVGAVRKRSLTLNDPTGGREFYDDTEYGRGMFFTLDDLKEVVAYAKERNIEIMPEIDMPGHMVAAIAAYPEFSCDPTRTYEVRVEKGVSTDVLNIGDDRVIDFLKCVLDHIAEVFPFPLIHLGGDECPTTVWQTNADCQRRIQEEGLSGVNELQPWLVETLGAYLKEKYGKEVVAWNELQDHWKEEYATDLVIMSWTSTPSAAAAKGFRSIYAKCPLLYFDMMQAPVSDLRTDEPYMGGYGDNVVSSIDMVYGFDPLEGLAADKTDYLLGTQANLWTESCTSDAEAEYQLYPRLLALSETAWLPADKKSWLGFYQRLQRHGPVLGTLGINYAKHYLKDPELGEEQQALAEARALAEAHVTDGVGYPATSVCENLRQAIGDMEANPGDAAALAALQEAAGAYKSAEIKQPEAGKTYQIVSASTYYKARYAGSTAYEKSGGVSFHYTPQVEPEELWRFEPQSGGGYVLRSLMSGKALAMPSYDAAVTLSEDGGTVVRVDRATQATGEITYVPGAVVISSVDGYAGSNVKRFYGNINGQVIAYDDAALAKPGTWRIVEVTDYAAQLRGLCEKCGRIIETSVPGAADQPSQEALDFLRESVVAPAEQELEAGDVDKAAYEKYVELYQQYLDMPRLSAIDLISEGHHYYIRNAYFTSYYARANGSTGMVTPEALDAGEAAFRWRFSRNDDGTFCIYNKATGTAATLESDAQDQALKLGNAYRWTLRMVTTDQGNEAIAIIDGSGQYSWYTNPSEWSYVLTKPYDWGASVWTLEKLEDLTGIGQAETVPAEDAYYDLGGRRVADPAKGVYVTSRGEKVLK